MKGHNRMSPRRIAEVAARTALFAEAVANGATIRAASDAAGLTLNGGEAMWKRIRREMGPQAC